MRTTRTNAGQLVAEPPDGKAYLSFAVIEEASIKVYVENWAKGTQGLTDLQVDVNAEVNEVNGLQQVYSVGSAKLEGKPIQWDLTIVKGGRKVLAVMALGEDLDGAAVQAVYASIRRMGPTLKGDNGIIGKNYHGTDINEIAADTPPPPPADPEPPAAPDPPASDDDEPPPS